MDVCRVAGGLLFLSLATAVSAQTAPAVPPELVAYFAQAEKAERIENEEERCLAYPDIPDNQWPAGAGKGRCRLLREAPLSLDQLLQQVAQDNAAERIDSQVAALLQAHFDDPDQRDVIFTFYKQFDGSGKAGLAASKWLKLAPESPFALTAMGAQKAAMGWDARGASYISETADSQIRRMQQHFVAAVPFLGRALELEPDLTPACLELAKIGRQSSDSLQVAALSDCLRRDPLSYNVLWESMRAAQPKWGGSMEAMHALGDYILKHGPENPMLYALLAEPAGYEGTQSRKWVDGIEGYKKGALAGPGAAMSEGAGRGYYHLQQPWPALLYLSQALRYWPKETQLREMLAELLQKQQLGSWAEVEFRQLEKQLPDSLQIQREIARALLIQGDIPASRPYLRRLLKAPGFDEIGLIWLCQGYVQMQVDLKSVEAQECTKNLVENYPDKADYWIWRLVALAAVDAPIEEAISRIKALADPENPYHAQYLKMLNTPSKK